MKVKQAIERSGRFYEPDTKDLLMPEIVVCPECGNFIYPYEEDKPNSYYFPNMTNEHRYHTKHYARAAFTCSECGCQFSREVDTYTEFKWDKIKLDISKMLMVLSIITLVLSAIHVIIHDIRFDVIQLVIIILAWATFLGSLIYYWRNSDEI
jgi:ribosomal protein L32